MEKPSPESAPNHSLALAEPLVLLFYKTLSIWLLLLQKMSFRLLSLHSSRDDFRSAASKLSSPAAKTGDAKQGGLELTGEEVEAVMHAMGIDGGAEGVTEAEVAGLFDEREPSLEEVEAAFQVFDEGRDGFIDAAELQSVLAKLGFREEAAATDACREMIAAYDENGDGRIDFDEFAKFIESGFC